MPGPDEHATARGRRDPSLRTLLDADNLSDDETEPELAEPEEYILLDGDTLMSKITLGPEANGFPDAWVTFGVQTRVMNGESEGHAFERLATITTNRAVEQVRAVEAAVAEEAAQRAEELRQHRISRPQQ